MALRLSILFIVCLSIQTYACEQPFQLISQKIPKEKIDSAIFHANNYLEHYGFKGHIHEYFYYNITNLLNHSLSNDTIDVLKIRERSMCDDFDIFHDPVLFISLVEKMMGVNLIAGNACGFFPKQLITRHQVIGITFWFSMNMSYIKEYQVLEFLAEPIFCMFIVPEFSFKTKSQAEQCYDSILHSYTNSYLKLPNWYLLPKPIITVSIDSITLRDKNNSMDKTHLGAQPHKYGGKELDHAIDLPRRVQYKDGHIVYYTYTADGVKLKASYAFDPLNAVVDPIIGPIEGPIEGPITPINAGAPIAEPQDNPDHPVVDPGIVPETERVQSWRDYSGDYIYLNGELERILTPVGYIDSLEVHHAFVKDYRGNVRADVTEWEGVVERSDYYPYGMQMQVPWSTMWTQPYKFMGKELDRENGWDSYDVHARWLTSPIAQWTTQDKLAEATPWLSPYSYCAANPIRYIDPTGENPVYTPDGEYLGDTNEGFGGMVMIYSGQKIDNLSELSVDELINEYGAMTMDEYQSIDELRLSGTALSKIWTNIVSHFEGEVFFNKRFTLKSIKNNIIGYSCPSNTDIKKVPNFSTEFYVKKQEKSTIYGTGTNNVDYENTVENLVCSIIYHEWLCHGTLKMSGDKDHILIFQNYVKGNRFWNKTTERFKKAVENKIEYYKKR